MVIVNSRAGGMSNRLVTIAHAMATAIERREGLLLTTFGELVKDYRCEVSWTGQVRIRESWWWEQVRRILATFRRMRLPALFVGRIVFDWSYRNHEALAREADRIRRFFTPIESFDAPVVCDGEVLVGVHKRRGDYKEFQGGRYYYDDGVYETNKDAVRAILEGRGFKVRFLEFPLHQALEDQWLMSRCDYLIGPPSTFSAWASFMGKVPLGVIWGKNYVLKADDLKYRGLYV